MTYEEPQNHDEGISPDIGPSPRDHSLPNRAARRKQERIRPLEQGKQNPDVGKGLANLFKPKEEAYVPVLKSLEQIGLEPKMMQVLIGEDPVQCFVIPCQDLVYKEWQHMTKAKFAMEPANGEAEDSGE